MKIESVLNRIWYNRLSIWAVLLWPLSMLFTLLAALNKLLFSYKIKSIIRLPVPVIVVGNITVGGTGKTPLTIYLAQELAQLGWKVGIISRGYKPADNTHNDLQSDTDDIIISVNALSDPTIAGDEPVLMARATAAYFVPVFVARHRAVAGAALLKAHPEVNVLLCDDGLQHHRLARDIELCVIDGARGLGNGLRLPAGPLREARSRLKTVNAIVVNGSHCLDWLNKQYPPKFAMKFQPQACYQLNHPHRTRIAADFAAESLTAMPGIGNPARFFNTLYDLGYVFFEQAMPDHHFFTKQDLPPNGAIIVTEKDAVKLANLNLGADGDRIWVLPIAAQIEPNLADWLHGELQQLRNS